MANDDLVGQLTDLADGTLTGPEWERWLAEHPNEAQEVEIARLVRGLLLELELTGVEVPADFEARLMQRVRGDTALLYLINLGLDGFGRTLLEILSVLFALLPAPTPARQPSSA